AGPDTDDHGYVLAGKARALRQGRCGQRCERGGACCEMQEIVWLYAPTSGWVRSTASTDFNMLPMRASETGLSTTTTRSGLLEEARTRPQVPPSTVTRTPLTVTRFLIGWPATISPLARAYLAHHLLDDPVFDTRPVFEVLLRCIAPFEFFSR